MAIVLGRKVFIYNGSGTTTSVIAAAKSCTVSTKRDLIERASATQGDAKEFVAGRYEWEVSMDHLVITDNNKQFQGIDILREGQAVTLSIYINGAGGTTQAFACYAVMDADTPEVLASQHAVTVPKNGSKTVSAISNVAGAVITYAVTTALSGVSVTNAGVISAGTTAGTAVVTVTATLPDDSTVTDTITVTVPA